MEQAGLAAAVGANQADELALGNLDRNVEEAAGQPKPGGAQDHGASLQRICATSQRKNGAPINAVTTPIGSVRPSGASRVTRSAAMSSSAPINAADRMACPGWPRVSRRAKIGATSPMKPIAPQIATHEPTPKAVRQITFSRSPATS